MIAFALERIHVEEFLAVERDAHQHADEHALACRVHEHFVGICRNFADVALAAGLLGTAVRHLGSARSAMLLGAHLAGLAFSNAPVAGVHALAYPLGGLHHLPHGLTNALMLRHVLGHNLEAALEHYAELAEIVAPDCAGEGSQARAARLIDELDDLVTRVAQVIEKAAAWLA